MSKYIGKPSPTQLKRLLGNSFGKKSDRILVGSGPGLDAAVLDLGDGRVMAVAEDPIFPAPKLPLDLMGWFTVHIGASDVAVTGIKPEFMTYTLLMPPEGSEEDAKTIIDSISVAAAELDISIVGGHTGWYSTVVVPIVGGVAVWGFGEDPNWVSPGGAQDGDIILMSKGPAIEAAALLAVLYREKLQDQLSADILDRLCARTEQISVVEDALTAFACGGVHAMHDATEGGVLGGLWEMSTAAGIKLHADLDALEVPEDIAQLAEALDFDLWQAISEGTLLAAVEPDCIETIQREWNKLGIPSYILGEFQSAAKDIHVTRDGREFPLEEPQVDPFWELFFAGLE
jgi:hydrogenase maturation factor